jgi:hypothetical protein
MSNGLHRPGQGEKLPYRFEYEPNRRSAAEVPIELHNGIGMEAVADIYPYLLEETHVVAPEETYQPLMHYAPIRRVPYPNRPGRYLRIAAYAVVGDDYTGVNYPDLLLVVRLSAAASQPGGIQTYAATASSFTPGGGEVEIPPWPPYQLPEELQNIPTVTRVSLLGNLLFQPTYDDRGPLHNFGLPRTIRIFVPPSWRKPFSPENPPPHPRDWKLLYENTDLRGFWGWTHLDFTPVRTAHLIFQFDHLPQLPDNILQERAQEADKLGVPWHFRGLSIERLGIHAYDNETNTSPEAKYTPVVSWHSKYEKQPQPFVSKYWSGGYPPIFPVEQAKHQSIYLDNSYVSENTLLTFDLLPSALVGLPTQYQSPGGPVIEGISSTDDGYLYLPYYSGDLILGGRDVSTSLVIQTSDVEPPAIRGLRIKVPFTSRPEQNYTNHPEADCIVYYTDDPEVAFSSNPDRTGWKEIMRTEWGFYFGGVSESANFLWGQDLIFPHDYRARFYRLEYAFPEGDYSPPKRLELSELSLLRSSYPSLVAYGDEVLQLDEVQLRLRGPNILDDYAYINGYHIMNLTLEVSRRGRPYEPILNLRNLLDVREKTRAQIIARQRATRSRKQVFEEDHDAALQRAYSVIRQIMTRGSVAGDDEMTPFGNNSLLFELTEEQRQQARTRISELLRDIEGITTDRDMLVAPEVLDLFKLLDTAGVPAIAFRDFINSKNTSSFWKLLRVPLPGKTLEITADGLIDRRSLTRALYSGVFEQLPSRPSLSLSGSFGGQFIGGGSLGVSVQLDGGKSTSVSEGSQGQANETMTVTGETTRRVTRKDIVEQTEWYDWKGQEIKVAGAAMDIVTIRVPVGIVLSPNQESTEKPDSFRVRVDLLPPGVKLDVKFIGTARPLDKEA